MNPKRYETQSSDRTQANSSLTQLHTHDVAVECSAVWGARNSQGMAVQTHPEEVTRPVSRCVGARTINPVLIKVIALVMLFVVPAFGGGYRNQGFDSREAHIPASKLSSDLQKLVNAGTPGKLHVIVQYRVTPQQRHYDEAARQGGKLRHRLNVIQSAAFDLPVSGILQLAKDPEVRYITLDRHVQMSLDYVAKAAQADIAWTYGYDGTGVGIAIIDSGIYPHPDLNQAGSSAPRVVYSESFVSGDPSTLDAYGHGTHVAGIAAGNGQSSVTGYRGEYKGIAPNANIINLRVLDANGSGSDSAVIAAIQRAIQLKNQYNIQVINLSLGRGIWESYTLDPLCQAVEQAWQSGIVVVVAAGNSGRDNSLGTHGYATIAAPGNDPYVITVGAMNMNNTYLRNDDTIASYSSRGPSLIDHIAKPDLVAPGNRVVSLLNPGATLENEYPSLQIYPCNAYMQCNSTVGPAQYFRLSGTSMATPVVAGAAALMLQANPTLTPDLVKARLMKSAYKGFAAYSSSWDAWGNQYNSQADLFTYGAGYLDIAAALQNTDMGTGVALSPTAVYNPSTRTVSLSYGSLPVGNSVLWGTSVIWGTSVVWGSNVFVSGSSVLWGSSVVWGSSTTSGFSVVWGTSVIWGSSTNQAFSPGDDGDCPLDPTTGLPVCN